MVTMTEGIYLNNYIRWDSKAQHEKMIEYYNYETENQQRTFDAYNDVDCFHYSGLHDLIKYMKYGYGKVTDHVSREIRLKRLTRNDGIELVKKYSNIEPVDTKLFCDWLNININELFKYVNQYRSKVVWSFKKGSWKIHDSIMGASQSKFMKKHSLEKIDDCVFNSKSKREQKSESKKYTLIGRGWANGKSKKY